MQTSIQKSSQVKSPLEVSTPLMNIHSGDQSRTLQQLQTLPYK